MDIRASIGESRVESTTTQYKITVSVPKQVTGTTDHTQLQNLHADEQHPITSVIGLYNELQNKLNTTSYIDGGTF